MMLTEDSPVPGAALPVASFRAHLRLGSGFGEEGLQEALLETFLRAAVAAIEARCGKILLRRSFTLRLDDWRDASGQALPVAPAVALTRVAVLAYDGTEMALAPESYRLQADAQAPRIIPASGVLPMVPMGGGVEVSFTAGYAADWDGLPADLAQAVLLLAAHYYEYRDATSLGSGCMPFGVSALIERYRAVRVGAGR